MTVPHAALAPSGQPIWTQLARDSADTSRAMVVRGQTFRDVLTDDAIYNAMLVHAAVGGSTNLLLHIPAIAAAAGLKRPDAAAFRDVNKLVPRFVDCLPNGPIGHPTVRLFLAGGVPEVAWHLRELGLLRAEQLTVSGMTWNELLDRWQTSDRREVCRERLAVADDVDPDEVIIPPAEANRAGNDQHGLFSIGKPLSRRVGDQGDVDRSVGD